MDRIQNIWMVVSYEALDRFSLAQVEKSRRLVSSGAQYVLTGMQIRKYISLNFSNLVLGLSI